MVLAKRSDKYLISRESSKKTKKSKRTVNKRKSKKGHSSESESEGMKYFIYVKRRSTYIDITFKQGHLLYLRK